MAQALSHRGPDGSGVWNNDTVGFAHTRLAILDPDGGAQPMMSEDQSVVVVYNGEIYNFRELAAELSSRGYEIRTNCDTEILIHAWREWKEDCVKHFRGMFAFAVADLKERRVFLGRDHFGIKPLVYYVDKQQLIFASEIQAIRRVVNTITVDPGSIQEYLRFRYIPAPRTIFREVKKLPPGHTISVPLEGPPRDP